MDWEDGSMPFHWRWPEEFQKKIQDGLEDALSAQSTILPGSVKGQQGTEKQDKSYWESSESEALTLCWPRVCADIIDGFLGCP
jgi:hypothetical protein